jgi:hypothetical protein
MSIHYSDLDQACTQNTKKFYFFLTSTMRLTATIFPILKEVPERNLSGINNAAVIFDCSGGYIN